MFGPLAPLLFYRGALVYASIVDQDDSRNLVRLSRNLVEERDYIITCRRLLLRCPGQRAIVAQCPEHVHALPVRERLDGSGLADFRPSVLYWWIRTETDSSKYSSSHCCSWSRRDSSPITLLAYSNAS